MCKICILTVYADFDPFADRRRHAIARDAKIRTHVQSADTRQIQGFAFPFENCDKKREVCLHFRHFLHIVFGATGKRDAEDGQATTKRWELLCRLPDNVLLIVILVLSSRFHLTLGVGDPVALQVNVSFAPSRTMTSLLLRESSMFGGTVTSNRYTILFI